MKKKIVWNTDTQKDFVEPDGKLYVNGAEKLKPVFKAVLDEARKHGVQIINTADWHHAGSSELSSSPDMVSTFPEHCMAGTIGAEFIPETKPIDSIIFDWDKAYENVANLLVSAKDMVIHKDAFDVFAGNPYTEEILRILNPDEVFVFGVTTNVCVDYAVMGLMKRVKKVFVIEDAIKELPKIPLPFEKWRDNGIELITMKELVSYLD